MQDHRALSWAAVQGASASSDVSSRSSEYCDGVTFPAHHSANAQTKPEVDTIAKSRPPSGPASAWFTGVESHVGDSGSADPDGTVPMQVYV